MTLPLTPEMLAAAYDYLKATPPFKRWKLPCSSKVKFKVALDESAYGWYQWDGTGHTITASVKAVGHTSTLMQLMAHETIHLYLEMSGKESKTGDTSIHNARFRRCAALVCRHHGFDPKAFY
jgi:hypothetical protein